MKWNSLKAKALLAAASLYSTVAMAGPDLGEAEQQATNWHAIIMFLIFVGFTLFITMGCKTNLNQHKISIPQGRNQRFPKRIGNCR